MNHDQKRHIKERLTKAVAAFRKKLGADKLDGWSHEQSPDEKEAERAAEHFRKVARRLHKRDQQKRDALRNRLNQQVDFARQPIEEAMAVGDFDQALVALRKFERKV